MNALILAAGMSVRMGRAKLLLPYGKGTILSTVIDNVLEAGLDAFCVASREVEKDLLSRGAKAACVVNDSPEQGQSYSLKIGLQILPRSQNFCILLGDLPLITSDQIARYAAMFSGLGETFTALVPKRGATPGHPSFYAPMWIERFLDASGDAGGRAILARYEEEIFFCRGEESFFRDVDTPGDYASLSFPVV